MDKKEFKKFCNILEGEEGCNFRYEDKEAVWNCNNDHTFTKKILKKYFPNENVKKFLKFCEDNGGYCDCEILFNVDD